MRREVQQEQDGALHLTTCRRENKGAYRAPLRKDWLALDEEVRPRCRRIQILNYVRPPPIPATQIHSNKDNRNPDVWEGIEFPSDVVKTELQTYISKRLTPQPTKVRADVEVTCFGYEGIDAVKEALRKAEAKNTVDTPVKVKLVSPPLYVLTSQCLDKNTGIQVLEEAITEIQKSISAAGGSCVVKMAPKAVTENDDAELQALMDKKERENQEVSGDEDESISDEEV